MTIRHKLTTRFLLIPLGLGIIGAAGCSPNGGEESAEPAETRVLPVRVRRIQRVSEYNQSRSYTGLVAAHRTSRIGFERSGRVLKVLVEEGDEVTANQAVATVNDRHLVTRRSELESRLAQAEAMLAELEAGPRKQTIAVARKELRDLVAQRELAERNLKRSQSLMRQGATTQAQLDAQSLALRSAKARESAGEERLKELEIGSRLERVTAQRAVVKQLEASVSDLDLDVEDCTLRSPFAGRISMRLIDEGAFVSPGQALVEVMETGQLEARIGLPLVMAREFANTDQTVEVTIGDSRLPATFSRAQPGVDLQTRTRLVIFALAKDAITRVAPGQIARVQVIEEKPADGYWLPTTSLVQGPRGLWAAYAVVSKDSKPVVERRIVEVLHTEGDRSLVRGTLNDGDRIVISGTQRIVPGQIVDPTE